jgi:hypothetical protein
MHDSDRDGIGRISCSGQAKRPVRRDASLPPTCKIVNTALDIHENNLCESLRYHNRLGNPHELPHDWLSKSHSSTSYESVPTSPSVVSEATAEDELGGSR